MADELPLVERLTKARERFARHAAGEMIPLTRDDAAAFVALADGLIEFVRDREVSRAL